MSDLRTPPHTENPDWYRIKYALAAHFANESIAVKGGQLQVEEKWLDEGSELCEELLGTCWSTVEKHQWRWLGLVPQKDVSPLVRFLQGTVEPLVLTLWAGIALAKNQRRGNTRTLIVASGSRLRGRRKRLSPGEVLGAVVEAFPEPSTALAYNLACLAMINESSGRAVNFATIAVLRERSTKRASLLKVIAADPILGEIVDQVDAMVETFAPKPAEEGTSNAEVTKKKKKKKDKKKKKRKDKTSSESATAPRSTDARTWIPGSERPI